MELYFRDDSNEDVWDHLVWEAIDRRRMSEENEWNPIREMDVELPYQRDDTF
jgi:hypothetical protein